MTHGRLGSYKSFFTEQIAKTSASVAQLASAENRESLKTAMSLQYTKCQTNLKELAASNAVTQAKQTVLHGYEITKQGVSDVITSEPVQDIATSIQIVASIGSNKVKESITSTIGQENIDKFSQQSDRYKAFIEENYRLAKIQMSKFMESDEVCRLKTMLDDSTNSVLATNLVFDIGLKMAKETGSWHVGLQCSKYLVACMIVGISAYKPADSQKSPENLRPDIDLYQSQIDAAYEIAAQLHEVFVHIETLSQACHGPDIKPSFISSLDFEIKRDASP